MIEINDRTFLLNTANTSLLLMANEHGHIEAIHYGAPVALSDANALRYKRTLPYGSEVMYTKADTTYCLDNVPLLWSGIGKGDYRIPPAEIEMPDGSFTSDFVYKNYELCKGTCEMTALPCAYAEKPDEAETLILHLCDSVYAVFLDLYFTVFAKEDVITRRTVLRNDTNVTISLRRLMSTLIDLPNRGFKMVTLDGDWIAETHRHDRTLVPGYFVNESSTGFSSNRHNPGVILACETASETAGDVYGFNLIYSGNHYTAAELSTHGFVRVISGINPLCFSHLLKGGESFETPEAVMTYSGEGFGGMSRHFHDFIHAHIVRGEWRDRERPVLLNNWEACFFKFTRRKLLSLARRGKALGIELFVLDDGWFGARDNDCAGLGDYAVNRNKLPGGMKSFAKAITKMGMRFGLWFEPEAVNENSDLYRTHPEYAIKLPVRMPSYGRNELLLDLTKTEVRDYIVSQVGGLLDHAAISYVKWDMNRHMSDAFSTSCPSGEFYHRYILGLYEVLERIFRPRPHILLESCSSGGNRFDLGMLCYSPQIWASDDTDPIERLRIQEGLSYFYPPSTMGAHVSASPHQQTLRTTPLTTRFAVAAFGALGYELDPAELSPIEIKQIRSQISFYKKYRHTFQFGDFYREIFADGRKIAFTGVEKDGGCALTVLTQTLAVAGDDGDRLTVRGLDKDTEYTLKAVPQKVAISRFGGLIRHILPLRLRSDGFLIRTANRHYALTDGPFRLTASGAALATGIPLNTQFIGTGYHQDIRLWGDFDSQLYLTLQTKRRRQQNEKT